MADINNIKNSLLNQLASEIIVLSKDLNILWANDSALSNGWMLSDGIRSDNNISLVIFEPDAMYSSWEIRGEVQEVIDDSSANTHIDKLSNRYTGHPYNRAHDISWKDAHIKDREMWKIKINKLISMVRPQAKSDPE